MLKAKKKGVGKVGGMSFDEDGAGASAPRGGSGVPVSVAGGGGSTDKKKKKKKRPRPDGAEEKEGGAPTKKAKASSAPVVGGIIGVASGCKFEDLQLARGLHPQTLAAIAELGFSNTAPVQQATIPLLLSNKDVAVQACTGSGKTVAFLVPAFEMLLRSEDTWGWHDVGAIVIAPTRELAMQIVSVAQAFAKNTPTIRLLAMTGGSDADASLNSFLTEGGNVVIGTPGRLQHTMASVPKFNVKKLELLVLDEADRLLDMGFQATLNDILSKLPKQRRTGLFSATMNTEVAALARAGLRNPRQISVSQHGSHNKQQSTPLTLTNAYMMVEPRQKMNQLVHFLSRHKEDKIMVYLLTCAHVDLASKVLPSLPALEGVHISSLHGKMVQKRRSKTYESFVERDDGVLLCTDVAARGLDIPDVDWIVQYDAPQDPSFFIHRVGRTARMGRKGNSLLLLAPNEDTYVEFLTIRKVPLKQIGVEAGAKDVFEDVREIVRDDLDLHEKSQKAFVSFVRAYKEHQCNYIFQLDKLDLGGVACAMGLLKLPRMPEIRGVGVKGFKQDPVNIESLKYKDRVREKARRVRLAQKEKEAEAEDTHETRQDRIKVLKQQPWSKSNRLVKKTEKRQKQQRFDQGGGSSAACDDADDANDMEEEARLVKKLKQGKISKEEFDKVTGWAGSDGSDSD